MSSKSSKSQSVVIRKHALSLASLSILGLGMTLSACERIEQMDRDVEGKKQGAVAALETTSVESRRVESVKYNPLVVTDKVWGGNSALRMYRGMPFPAKFEGAKGITLVSASPMSLEDIAQAISAQTGIPIRLGSVRSAAATPKAPTAATLASATTTTTTTTSTAAKAGASASEMPISYEGSLSGLLDRLSAFFSVSWRFDGNSIAISRFDTRVFVMESMPGTHEINDAMDEEDDDSSSSSSGSSGTTSTQNTLKQSQKTTILMKYWEELTAVLNSMVSGNGTVVVSPTMGTVTVTTTPDIMGTVSEYIEKENKRLGQQIAINVKVYVVQLTNGEDFGVQFNASIGKLVKNVPEIAEYSTAASPVVTNMVGSLTMALLDSKYVRAKPVIEALSGIGNTAQAAEFTVTTMNNRPVARRVGTDTDYIRTVEMNQTRGGIINTGDMVTFTPVIDTVREGFSIQLTPRLMDDGRMLLQYSMGLNALREMTTEMFDIGTNRQIPIKLPTTDRRIFIQQSMLRSGQTLVIGGVDIGDTTVNRQGVGHPSNFLLGGGLHGNDSKFMMVIALTPQVMNISGDNGETN